MTALEPQGLTQFELVAAFFYLLFVMLGFAIYLRLQYIKSLPPAEDFDYGEKEVFKKGIDFRHVGYNVFCYLDGKEKAYSVSVDQKVYFFFTETRKEAHAWIEQPKNHSGSIERILRKVVNQKFVSVPRHVPKRVKEENWDRVKYDSFKNRAARQTKTKPNNISLDIT